ncbi:LOW QUALITY PROTEIN: small integral membrane protein 42 [Megaptera novaeangliae]
MKGGGAQKMEVSGLEPSALFEKSISSPQLPAFLWDKGTLTTAISDPAYLVKVLFFISLLMTLATLLILVWKVTDKGNKNREPDQRKEATLLA